MIVSISDATSSYKFELTRVYQPTKSYFIMLPTEIMKPKNSVITTSRQVYYESYFTAKRNVIDNSIASGTIKFDNEEQLRKNLQERIKRRNNPIELDYGKQ